MKNISIYVTASLLIFNACSRTPESDKAATGEARETAATAEGTAYIIDPAASMVKWIGTKVSGYHVGNIKILNGRLTVDGGTVTGGEFTMDMKSMDVSGPEGSNPQANAKLQGHLHSADFFDVEKYPTAKFEITSVTPFTGTVQDSTDDPRQTEISRFKVTNPTHTVSGNLTIKEITKNITFPARINVSDNSVDAMAKFNIDRREWDIVYPGKPDDLIRNEVHLGISIKATKGAL